MVLILSRERIDWVDGRERVSHNVAVVIEENEREVQKQRRMWRVYLIVRSTFKNKILILHFN